MGYINGVNLLPSTGEFTYDTIAYLGQRVTEATLTSINRYANGGPLAGTGSTTDYTIALNNLQAEFPGCTTVALVVAWFGNSTDVTACQIYPSTTYINGSFEQASGGSDVWRCSSLTQSSSGLIAIPQIGDAFIYGGTPSDQSIVRCIRDLKSRGLRVVFYPFILMTATGEPWRGRITYNGTDISSAATTAVNNFLGAATTSQFTRDNDNLTVAYSGSPTDYTYRRMILHYANLCVVAGGVDLFLLGSEFRGMETIRGPAWTKAGTTGGDGKVTWDYPFVAGLMQLADDVRSVFDAAALTKDTVNLHNLIAYSADWSVWMGYQHPGENGQWPHLDQLYGHGNIDLVSFDNYLPLSDWTTGDGGLDAQNWLEPAPSGAWPPSSATFNGLGMTGQPTIYSIPYLKANIEGGENFNWFYNDSNNLGIGLDPNGTDLRVSLPEGDRLTQSRNPYYPTSNCWRTSNCAGGGTISTRRSMTTATAPGSPHGPYTEWAPQSKSITFAEYGFPACDRGTNQPNVFYGPASIESATPFWSIWDPSESVAGDYWPRRDDELHLLALQAIYEYWVTDGNNETVGGVPMIQTAFMSVWNWDARPFPTFPQMSSVWGDAGNWPAGNWLGGKGPFLPVPVPDTPPAPGPYSTFPAVPTLGWSVTFSPIFFDRIGAACLRPRGARRKIRRPAVGDRAELRSAAHGVAEHRIAGHRRLLRTVAGRGCAVLFRAADALAGCRAGARHRRRRDHDVPVHRVDRRRRAIAGKRRHGVGRLSQRRGTAERLYAVHPTALAPSVTFATAPPAGAVTPPISTGTSSAASMTTARIPRSSWRRSTRCNRSSCARCDHDHAAFAAEPCRSLLVAAQEAWLFDARGLACVRPRGARRADEYPLYEFEAVYNGLASSTAAFAGLGASSLQSLMGFFLQLQGQFGTFLYTDPDDNAVTGQAFATGDGSTTSFTMMRSLGGFLEPVGWVTSVANVYLNGVAQSGSSYSPDDAEHADFTSAPASGATVSADFSYAFNCRFLDDQMDFEEFMASLWKLDSMKFRSVKSRELRA